MTLPNGCSRLVLAIAVILGIAFDVARPDWWPPASEQEYYSSTRGFVVRVTPSSKSTEQPGKCMAELYRLHGVNEVRVWRRHLINDEAPVTASITNSGKYLVTMDEWERFGTLPLVIYDRCGDLIASHDLESIEKHCDARHDCRIGTREVGTSGTNWREDALVFFGPDEEMLFIRLSSGAIRVVQLSDGTIMTEGLYEHQVRRGIQPLARSWHSLMDFGKKRTAELALDALESPDAAARSTGAKIVAQMNLREGIVRLRALLSDGAYAMTLARDNQQRLRVYFVRKAARDALKSMGETVGGVVVEEAEPTWQEPMHFPLEEDTMKEPGRTKVTGTNGTAAYAVRT